MVDNELIIKANQGDVTAMVTLAHEYLLENNFYEGSEWADKAAAAGHPLGMYLSLTAAAVLVIAHFDLGAWSVCIETCENMMQNGITLLRANQAGELNLEQERVDSIIEDLKEAYYYRAACAYAADPKHPDYDMVIKIYGGDTNGKKIETRAAILLSDAYFSKQQYAEALTLFRQIAADQKYQAKEKDKYDEYFYLNSMIDYALMYRLGIPGVLSVNLDKGHEILTTLLATVKNDAFKQTVLKELSHYQKKLFGGWKIV